MVMHFDSFEERLAYIRKEFEEIKPKEVKAEPKKKKAKKKEAKKDEVQA